MKLLETKEQLTLNELLRIAYEYGNDNADIPTDSENIEQEFSEWIKSADHLFKKLIIPVVSNSLPCNWKGDLLHKYGYRIMHDGITYEHEDGGKTYTNNDVKYLAKIFTELAKRQ